MTGDRLVTGCWVALTALRTEQRGMGSRPMVVVVSVVQPVVFLFLVAGTRHPGPGEAGRLFSAVVLTAVWTATVWTAGGVLRRERTYGTLARTVTGLYPPGLVLFGKSLGATMYSVLAILVSSAGVMAVLGLPVAVPHPLWAVAALLAVLASGTALGMLLSCLFLVTRHGLAWSGALIYPVFILGGLLIPAGALHPWLRWVPALVSLHWVHEFVVGTIRGPVRLAPLGAAGLLSLAYLVLALVCLRLAVRAARRRGTLDLF